MSTLPDPIVTNPVAPPVPAVSVLLPVFNGAPTLHRAAQSVLDQTFRDLELLIVDDGSTDDSIRIAEEVAAADCRVRVVRNPRNLGLSATLNRGLAEARAPFLARMDADDEALPDRLELQVAYMKEHPEVDVLGGGAYLMDSQGRDLGLQLRRERHAEMERMALRENPFIHPTVVMRREFLEELGGYDEGLGYPGDYDLWLRGIQRFRYHNLPMPLIRYEVPERASLNAVATAAGVMMSHGLRRRRPVEGAVGALRHVAAHLLNVTGIRKLRFADRDVLNPPRNQP